MQKSSSIRVLQERMNQVLSVSFKGKEKSPKTGQKMLAARAQNGGVGVDGERPRPYSLFFLQILVKKIEHPAQSAKPRCQSLKNAQLLFADY